MKTKTKKREKEIIWNLAYSLIFTIATNRPKVSVAYSKKNLFLTYAACRLQTCCTSTWLHWAPHSNAQLCSVIPALKEHPPAGTRCSHDRYQKYKRADQSMIAHLKHSHGLGHTFYLVTSCWLKWVTWPIQTRDGEVDAASGKALEVTEQRVWLYKLQGRKHGVGKNKSTT